MVNIKIKGGETVKQKIDWRVIIAGLFCITLLELYALSLGINGILLATVIAIVAGAIGISIPNPIKIK